MHARARPAEDDCFGGLIEDLLVAPVAVADTHPAPSGSSPERRFYEIAIHPVGHDPAGA